MHVKTPTLRLLAIAPIDPAIRFHKQPVVTIRHSFRHTHDAVLARLLSLLQEIGPERVIRVRGIPPVPR
jgi:hypothetical protein